MLNSLSVKNVALIEEMEIEFSEGLNIISGETGSGKSMIIDSINFILGQRAPKDFIRAGTDCAQVECVIEVNDNNREKVIECGIDIDDDNLLIIQRGLYENGKTICKINGKTASIGMVKEISELLFDLHGQHEHQSLLKASRHIDILDKFCGTQIEALKDELNVILKELKAIELKAAEIGGEDSDRESRIDLYSYQIEEIKNAKLSVNEEDELVNRRKILSNSEEITEKTKTALNALDGGYSGDSVTSLLGVAVNCLNRLQTLDPECTKYAEIIDNIQIQLNELVRDLHKYESNLDHDPNELIEIEKRLDLIYNLKRKYGRTVGDVLLYLKKTTEKYNLLINSGELLNRLNEEREELKTKAYSVCENISDLRKKAAASISQKIEKSLRELEMKDAVFSIIVEKKEGFTASGYDRVEFMISPNAGEELKPLANIASGGEISRVMLAIKTVLAGADTIETFIFDEIDTGVSGRTAQKVAEKLALLSGKHQILCITHLPQIAAMANMHLLVEKTSNGEKTVTNAYALNEDKIKIELARLIGGAKITNATLLAAAELRELAKKTPV